METARLSLQLCTRVRQNNVVLVYINFVFFFFLHGVGIRNETIRAGKVDQ